LLSGKETGADVGIDRGKGPRFFLSYASREFTVNFYGGEPLLEFDLIRTVVARTKALARASGRRPRFALTTNGSLITDDVLDFLAKHRFSLVLSFDGSAQDDQRAEGSEGTLRNLISRILAGGGVRLEVNSVFTPARVSALARTVIGLDELGLERIRFGLSMLEPWDEKARRRLKRELRTLGVWARKAYVRPEDSPLMNFREEVAERRARCPAGRDRLAVDPAGNVWGCALFGDYAGLGAGTGFTRRYCFGSIRRLAAAPEAGYARIAPNYRRLEDQGLRTSAGPCFLCPRSGFCRICPINAALAGGRLGEVSDQHCRIQKTRISGTPHKTRPRAAASF
jgi:sulfatase maturation enzyme AslB (radical SAM superfamily)